MSRVLGTSNFIEAKPQIIGSGGVNDISNDANNTVGDLLNGMGSS